MNKQIKSRTMAQETWRMLKKNKGAMVGLTFTILLIVIAIASGFIFSYEEDVIAQSRNRLIPPNSENWFGTDSLGRDIFARILYGSRYSLAIGFGSVIIGLTLGIITGSLAGYYGGHVDQFIMRANDILFSIPNIMIAVVVVSLLGTSTLNLLFALSVTVATAFARIARASVMTLRGQEFVESAYALGLPTWKILAKHIIPNCLSPIIVQLTLSIGTTIIAASSLSFLGIGVPSPAPEWGAMLSSGRTYIRSASYICVIPGIAIMLTVLALNLLGDGLRDALDPKLKR